MINFKEIQENVWHNSTLIVTVSLWTHNQLSCDTSKNLWQAFSGSLIGNWRRFQTRKLETACQCVYQAVDQAVSSLTYKVGFNFSGFSFPKVSLLEFYATSTEWKTNCKPFGSIMLQCAEWEFSECFSRMILVEYIPSNLYLFRFIITLALIIGSLYMLHLLILDVTRIFRRPRMLQTLLRSKRSNPLEEIQKINQKWDKILEYDPLKCVESLVCQLSSGAEKNNTEAKSILNAVGFTYYFTPKKIKHAYDVGRRFANNTDKCFDEYPFCMYSAGFMLRLLNWFLGTLT